MASVHTLPSNLNVSRQGMQIYSRFSQQLFAFLRFPLLSRKKIFGILPLPPRAANIPATVSELTAKLGRFGVGRTN
jgi:hypothetical protein